MILHPMDCPPINRHKMFARTMVYSSTVTTCSHTRLSSSNNVLRIGVSTHRLSQHVLTTHVLQAQQPKDKCACNPIFPGATMQAQMRSAHVLRTIVQAPTCASTHVRARKFAATHFLARLFKRTCAQPMFSKHNLSSTTVRVNPCSVRADFRFNPSFFKHECSQQCCVESSVFVGGVAHLESIWGTCFLFKELAHAK